MSPPADGAPLSAFTGQNSLRLLVEGGEFPLARLDDMILRLVPGFRLGVFDHPAKAISGEVSTPERRAAPRGVITGGAVLLKNEQQHHPHRRRREVHRYHWDSGYRQGGGGGTDSPWVPAALGSSTPMLPYL